MNRPKILTLYFAVGFVGLFLFFAPQNLFAAQLILKNVTNTVAGDGTTIIEARIDPQSERLNVVEGAINFQGAITDKLSVAVETGGSVLTIWPTVPKFLSNEKSIRFVGGVPGGFDHEGLLFRIRLFATVSGDITISLPQGAVYLNDGKGTKEPVSVQSVILHLDKQDPNTISTSSPDNIPPYFDSVEIGQDPNSYDGKSFVSFHATDDISGVARYEVTEGSSTTEITDGVYVFKDQDRKVPVLITAYDQVGNSQTTEIPARFNKTKDVILVLIFVVILLAVLLYGFKKIIKK